MVYETIGTQSHGSRKGLLAGKVYGVSNDSHK